MLFTRRPSPVWSGTIQGEKTRIRPLERRDVDCWLAWPQHTDPLFQDYNPPPMTQRQRDAYYYSRQGDPSQRMFAVDDERGELIGRISLRNINPRARTAVLGISFHPQRLNQGYGTDALRAFLRYYFEVLQMEALFLDVAAFNHRARRVYEKCGFRVIGQRWGEPWPDLDWIFREPRGAALAPYFRPERHAIRPLMIDMVIRRQDYERRAAQGGQRSGQDFSETSR